MFNKLYNRVTVTGTLVAKTALHIGAGQDSFEPLAVQGSVLKDHNGNPYIPGSSVKGVLRSFLESVQTMPEIYQEEPEERQQKGGSAQECRCERGETCVNLLGIADKAGRDEAKTHWGTETEESFTETLEAKSCMACRLFGSSVLSGKVKLRDAYLAEPDTWNGTDLRSGNAIERDTHTTHGGALFDMEAIPPNTGFVFKVSAENLTKEEAKCLGELLWFFADGGITVGGRSRAGCGEIVIRNISLTQAFKVEDSYMLETITESVSDQRTLPELLGKLQVFAPEPRDCSK